MIAGSTALIYRWGLWPTFRPTLKGNEIVNALKGRSALRTLLGLLAALGLVAAMAMPVAASSQVLLHEPHKGTDSSDAASFEADDCGTSPRASSGISS